MSKLELTPEARKMLFEMAKHLTTIDVAGILLVIALIEKFPGQVITRASAAWTIGLFTASLLISVSSMFVLVGMEASRSEKSRDFLFVAFGW